MSKKHYVIWKGLKPGIYDNWNEAKAQVEGRNDAQYMGFPSLEEAQQSKVIRAMFLNNKREIRACLFIIIKFNLFST